MKSRLFRLASFALFVASCFAITTYTSAADSRGRIPPIGKLPTICREAKARFRPLTEADLQELKAELGDALARLDKRLAADGENGVRWRTYLRCDRLQSQLQDDRAADLAVLDAVYKRYTAGHQGLELVWFLDVRHALRRYRELARNVGNPALKTRYQQLLDFLAARLDAYADAPSAEDAQLIGQAIGQLEEFRQAPALVRAIRHHYLRPNLMLTVSADVVAAGIDHAVDETAPVRDVILGTDIHGTGHTTGQVCAELLPDESRAVIKTVFLGTVETRNVGYHGPVRVYSNGSTEVDAGKRLWIDATGLDSQPAVSSATTTTKITGIRACRGGKLVERIAWKRACRQKCQAEQIASRHAEQRINEKIDQEAADSIDLANRAFLDKFRKPLLQRNLFPRQLRFTTTREALRVVSLQADHSQLAAPTPPPEPPKQFDMALSLHQSMVNNLAASALTGITLRGENLEAFVVELLGELPEQLQADEDQEDWGIAFARSGQPISVLFADHGFRVTVRGSRFYKGPESYPGMDVTAVYKIEKTPRGFAALRQGDLQILPPGFVTGSRKLSPQEVVIRTLLQRRFERIFKKKTIGEGLFLPGKWAQVGKMNPVRLDCSRGWLSIAWKRGPSQQTVASNR